MAMIKDTDITASLIAEQFPSVHADILGQATANAPEITAESLKASHPDVAAAIMDEGKASAEQDTDGAVAAERERIASINVLARPGAEAIISAALADSSVTAEKVKIQLFDADEATRTKAHSSHKDDGKKLAVALEDLNNPEGEDEKKDDTTPHSSIMDKIKRGEK